MTDQIQRFIFDSYGIRGQMVKLGASSQRMLKAHQYPTFIADLLQQTAAVSILLATTLKFEGKISIQLQPKDKVKMLLVQTSHQLGFRGLARFDESVDFSNMTFEELVKDGQMSITIEPSKGKRYQGIVPLVGNTIAECIEGYFKQSEQLETRIWLFNNDTQVFGLMLQALPNMPSKESFEHLVHLASTLQKDESLTVDNETLMHRLFHEETVNHLAINQVEFNCGCSQSKMLESVTLLSKQEIDEIIATESSIDVTCEFCLSQFSFTEIDLKQHQAIKGNKTQH